jgi:hypothetical protein
MAASTPPLVRTAVATLSVGQRGAYGLDLRTPQRVEDHRTAGRQGVLCVDGDRHRAPPVSARGGKLSVAEEVARVAPHRPATRLVAEDPQPSRVLARTGRFGAPPSTTRLCFACVRSSKSLPPT